MRLVGLGAQSFWYDESFTVRIAHGPVSGLLDRLSSTESTPPLYYLLASGWQHVAGSDEAGLRSLSLLCGVALVPIVFLIGRMVSGETAGLLAAAFAATSPELVWMSQEARSYALFLLLVTASVATFLLVRERASPGRLLAWALLAGGALASHYFAVFLVLPQAIWLLLELRERAWWGLLIIAGTLLALSPLALDQRDTSAILATGGQSLTTRLPAVPKRFLAAESASEFDTWWVLAATAMLVLAGLLLAAAATSASERRRLGPLALLSACGLGLPVLAALVGADYVNARNLLGVWPLILVLAATGLSRPRAHPAGLAAGAALCIAALGVSAAIAASDSLQRDDWRGAAERIRAGGVGPVLLLDPAGGSAPLSLYLHVSPLRRGGTRTRTIAVIALRRGRSWPAFVPPPPFRAVSTAHDAGLAIITYAAPETRRITPTGIVRAAAHQRIPPPEGLVQEQPAA